MIANRTAVSSIRHSHHSPRPSSPLRPPLPTPPTSAAATAMSTHSLTHSHTCDRARPGDLWRDGWDVDGRLLVGLVNRCLQATAYVASAACSRGHPDAWPPSELRGLRDSTAVSQGRSGERRDGEGQVKPARRGEILDRVRAAVSAAEIPCPGERYHTDARARARARTHTHTHTHQPLPDEVVPIHLYVRLGTTRRAFRWHSRHWGFLFRRLCCVVRRWCEAISVMVGGD